MKRKHRRRSSGFTLMEVLLVLVILVILGSMAGLFLRGAQKKALVNAARAQIGSLKAAVDMYEIDLRNYPAEGLNALRQPPANLRNPDRWGGPYLDTDVPLDPWDSPYRYELINPDNFKIWSLGPDGTDGTDDDIRM